MRSYLMIISSHSGFILRPQMSHFSVPKWTHFRSPNGTISGPQMSPFRDPQDDPKRTTLMNWPKITTPSGIARENAGSGTSGHIAQSPSHSLSHPSDGFATTPARTAAARASVICISILTSLSTAQGRMKQHLLFSASAVFYFRVDLLVRLGGFSQGV